MIKLIERLTETERMAIVLFFSLMVSLVMHVAGIAYVVTFSLIYYFGCKEARNAKV